MRWSGKVEAFYNLIPRSTFQVVCLLATACILNAAMEQCMVGQLNVSYLLCVSSWLQRRTILLSTFAALRAED
ncbi:hypothetical protein QR685DRAFT_509361 [Neurospora intermedia]|uniref:Uncharacterized protein n=1 Tax=Neurospora intermedia TaxID=5142 RepID=A0ABR3DNP9_NEUIN